MEINKKQQEEVKKAGYKSFEIGRMVNLFYDDPGYDDLLVAMNLDYEDYPDGIALAVVGVKPFDE